MSLTVLMVNTFHYRRGGDATCTLHTTELLRSAGHRVVPFAMQHPDNEPSPYSNAFAKQVSFRGSRAQQLRGLAAMGFNLDAYRRVRRLMASERPDVVHVHHLHHHLSPSVVLAASREGIPVVWTTHDYELICPAGTLFDGQAPCVRCVDGDYTHAIAQRCKRGSVWASAAAGLEQAMHRGMDLPDHVRRFLAPSEFMAQQLRDFGLPAERIAHLPNPVPTPPAGPVRAGEGVIYIGRLAREKGVQVLIEAARRHGFALTLYGAGPMDPELRSLASGLDVRFAGHVPGEQVEEALRAAAVVVVPSIWYENFPYAVTEAQRLGRAVVASRIGGIPEQVDDSVDGRLVDHGEPEPLGRAIAELLANPSARVAMGEAGRERVRSRLDPEAYLQRLLTHYRDVATP